MPSSPQPLAATPSSNNQNPIAQQLAALQATKQQSASPSPAIHPSPVPPKKARFAWTGFKGKTLWDWLDFLVKLLGALAIPLVVVLASNALNTQQQQTTETQHQNELAIADDQQKEATLKAYLDDMTSLLLNNHLHDSNPDAEVRNVARIKTLTTMRQLNGPRKGLLLQFLYEAGLLTTPIVSLKGADLTEANLTSTHFIGADLTGTDLTGANLIGANLIGANLTGANLTGDNLTKADLTGANLTKTGLSKAHLSGINLSRAHLPETDLSGANLIGAHLTGAHFTGTNLIGADLTGANLTGANLTGANLTKASVTNAQLATAYSLENTILPNGSIHP